MKLMQKAKSHIASGYKKKLLLNLVVALFNRGVQYLLRGDHENHKININQSLELATQKFGKDEVITHMVLNMARKDKSEMMPFFVNKFVDLRNLLNEERDNEAPIYVKDVLVREPDEDVVLGKASRSVLRNSQEHVYKEEKSRINQHSSLNGSQLPLLKPKRKEWREPSEERSYSVGPTREQSQRLPPNPGNRSATRSLTEKRVRDVDGGSSLISPHHRSGLASSESHHYTFNRVSLALKYMK
jgi:hypothetical protein